MSADISGLPDEVIVDPEITLVLKKGSDLAEFIEITSQNKEHLLDWMPWASDLAGKKTIEHYANSESDKRNNIRCDWKIVLNGETVGAIGLRFHDEIKSILNIGYWLSEEYEGKGIISKSVQILSKLAFEKTDTQAIEIGCDKANIKSAAVAIRCGYVFDREIDRTNTEDKARCETDTGLFYRLTRESWEATR